LTVDKLADVISNIYINIFLLQNLQNN